MTAVIMAYLVSRVLLACFAFCYLKHATFGQLQTV
jgi:hypothetical protein